MRVSTRGIYGLEALLDLAVHSNGEQEVIPLKDIAKRRGISANYLEQLFAILNKSGVVTSSRGIQGGYRLAKEPAYINVPDVINVLEGPLVLVPCVLEDGRDCGASDKCAAHLLWRKAVDTLYKSVEGICLQDLVDLYSIESGIEAIPRK